MRTAIELPFDGRMKSPQMRGYASFVVLKTLMQKIQVEEEKIQAKEEYIRRTSPAKPVAKVERRRYSRDRTSTDPIAPGILNGAREDAFVDTCARNFVTAEYLRKHGLDMFSEAKHMITRADGSKFSTLGTVSLPWTFEGEDETHVVDFDVLASNYCNHAITLGGKFLLITKTLTRFASRIVRRLRNTLAPRVFFQDGGQLRIMGFCDGQEVAALPDTGSDIPLMSPSFAFQLGLDIDDSEENQILVELPGKHYVHTQGIIRDVEWRFGAQSTTNDCHSLDFYILDGLCSDVLLDADFLLGTNAFETHEDSLFELSSGHFSDCEDLFCNIRLVLRTKGLLMGLLGKLRVAKMPAADVQMAGIDTSIGLLDEIEVVLRSSKTQQEKEVRYKR